MQGLSLGRIYARATNEQKERGRRWYPTALTVCEAMAEDFGTPLERVVGIFAVVSVNAQLSSNLEWTRSILAGERSYGRYGTQTTKVRGILDLRRDPWGYITGPKVRPFARAILGDETALVLDRWAMRAASEPVTRSGRIRAADKYRRVAIRNAESLRDTQAIIWVTLREFTIPGLRDIHHDVRKGRQ